MTARAYSSWTAVEVKDKLRGRHAATQMMGRRVIPGAWTCVEELLGCDLIAFSAHKSPSSGGVPGVHHPRVGYEVKVSRGDLRAELLRPAKRASAVVNVNAFYLAVPRGLLTDAEKAWEQPPDWTNADFSRTDCPGQCHYVKRTARGELAGQHVQYTKGFEERVCEECRGVGPLPSRAERDAPQLWVPPDVGLVEVYSGGCSVAKAAPTRKDLPQLTSTQLAQVVRFVSSHPDPRHDGVVEAARKADREERALYKEQERAWRERQNAALEAYS